MKKFTPALLALILVILTAVTVFSAPVRTIYGTVPNTNPEGTYALLSGVTALGDGTAYDLGMTVSQFTCQTTLAGQVPTNTVVKLKGSTDGSTYDDLGTDTWTPSNYITNGTFTGNANSWTLGAGWAYSTNDVDKTAGVGTASQAVASLAVVPQNGEKYVVEINFTAWTKGNPVVTFLGGTGTASAVLGAAAYIQYPLTASSASGALTITPAATDDGYTIDDVIMIRNEHLFHVNESPVRYIKGTYVSKSGGGATTAVTLTCTAGGN